VHVSAEDERSRFYPEEFRRWGHLRFSVGLEDPRDLVADLDQALTRIVGPPGH
jgi:methionine-gamma-lyase